MANIDPTKAHKALIKKGFIQKEGDHHWYLYYHNNKVVARTKMSHNNQDIGDGLISKMYKQCQISKTEFFDLINCPLEQEDYLKILDEKGLLL